MVGLLLKCLFTYCCHIDLLWNSEVQVTILQQPVLENEHQHIIKCTQIWNRAKPGEKPVQFHVGYWTFCIHELVFVELFGTIPLLCCLRIAFSKRWKRIHGIHVYIYMWRLDYVLFYLLIILFTRIFLLMSSIHPLTAIFWSASDFEARTWFFFIRNLYVLCIHVPMMS